MTVEQAGSPLFQHSPWWVVLYVALLLVMLHAMMELTVAFLFAPADKARTGREPSNATALRARLVALNDDRAARPLVVGEDCDLEARWSWQQSEPRPGIWSRGRGTSRLRLELDEARHELRLHLVESSFRFFAGLQGWLPRIYFSAGFGAGPPGGAEVADLVRVAHRSGWHVRPVLWWFEATHTGLRVLRALTPPPLRGWPVGRLWCWLYPLSFFASIGYLVALLGPPTASDWWIIAGVSTAWWTVWGFLAWLLRRGAAAGRRRRR